MHTPATYISEYSKLYNQLNKNNRPDFPFKEMCSCIHQLTLVYGYRLMPLSGHLRNYKISSKHLIVSIYHIMI